MVQQRGSVTVSELAAEFGCSEMTIRRDLDALGRDGVVRRMVGSAVTASLRADEKPYPVRAFEASAPRARACARPRPVSATGRAGSLLSACAVFAVDSACRAKTNNRSTSADIAGLLPLGVLERRRRVEPGAGLPWQTSGLIRAGIAGTVHAGMLAGWRRAIVPVIEWSCHR
jgi:DNA-binding Lrp family transcriptional regulator